MRLAAALVFAALLVGCGSDAKQTFVDRGNAICREAKRKGLGNDGLARLKALEPPAGLRDERDRFFADLSALARLTPVKSSADRAKAVAIINRLPDEARALGWTDCAG
ncbi:MAG: hypothetical protein QOE91_546 [Gaiellaceae bacterium]|nr:hypothetical protein [Gaiellaceae bacterium]